MASQSVSESLTPILDRAGTKARQTARGDKPTARDATSAAIGPSGKVTPPVSVCRHAILQLPLGGNSKAEHTFRKSFSSSDVQTVVTYGPSGCGRSRLIQKLIYSDPSLYTLAILHTSRKRRLYEVDGREMFFVSQAEMTAGVESGRFIAHTRIAREQPRYAVARSSSAYDLAEKDDPSGELFGISQEALVAAYNSEKPIVIINFNSDGAKQLKRAGVKALYVLLYSRAATAGTDDVGADHTICIDQNDEAMKELQELAHGLLKNIEQGDIAVEQAKLDWDLVPTLQISTSKQDLGELHKTVSFVEVLVHIQHVTLLQVSGTRTEGSNAAAKFWHLHRNTKLSRSLQSEYGTIFGCAQCNLDDSDPVHLLTLQTIYKKLTGNKVNCPRIGSHWQAIGFQSNDPADDLQGAGFLGLMQLLFFLDNARTLLLAQEMHTHFKHTSGQIPFCGLSLRATQLVLGALKDERLTKECKKRDQIFQVVNELYLGIMNRCYQLCKGKQQSKGCHELSILMVEVGRQTSTNAGVKSLLKDGYALLAEKDGTDAVVSKVSFNSFTQL